MSLERCSLDLTLSGLCILGLPLLDRRLVRLSIDGLSLVEASLLLQPGGLAQLTVHEMASDQKKPGKLTSSQRKV